MLQVEINAKFWTIPNIISIFRILLVIPLFYFLSNNLISETLIIFILAYISDIGDGYIARKTNNISEWGKIIDPLADKLFVVTAAIIMTINGYLPLWYSIAAFSRDILILIGGVYATKKLKYTLPSNYTGKAAVLLIGITMLLALFKLNLALNIFIAISLIMMLISLISYSKRLFEVLKNNKKQ